MEIEKFVQLEKKMYQIKLFIDETTPYNLHKSNCGQYIKILLSDGTSDDIDTFEKLRHYCNQTLNWFWNMYDKLANIFMNETNTLLFWDDLVRFIKDNYVVFKHTGNFIWLEKDDISEESIKADSIVSKGGITLVNYKERN